MKVALDSNILAYVAGVQRVSPDLAKVEASRLLMDRLRSRVALLIPSQVLGELFNVMLKGGFERQSARQTVLKYAASYQVTYGNRTTFTAALDLAVNHKLQIWDALILATAAEAGCVLLLSEDMQDGFATRGIRVANPFARRAQPQLAALLDA